MLLYFILKPSFNLQRKSNRFLHEYNTGLKWVNLLFSVCTSSMSILGFWFFGGNLHVQVHGLFCFPRNVQFEIVLFNKTYHTKNIGWNWKYALSFYQANKTQSVTNYLITDWCVVSFCVMWSIFSTRMYSLSLLPKKTNYRR